MSRRPIDACHDDTPSRPSIPPPRAGSPTDDEGFIGLVGPFWSRPSGDSFLYAFMAETKHHNRRGVVQGGMLMTFADRSMGMTCWYANERQPQATVQLDMHFIDAVQVGEFVEAKCKVVRRTRSLVFMAAELVVGDARRRHRQRRVEDAGQAVVGLKGRFEKALGKIAKARPEPRK